MCSKSKLGELAPVGSAAAGAVLAEAVSAAWVKSHAQNYYLVDVTEGGEGDTLEATLEGQASVPRIPLGELIRDIDQLKLEGHDSSKTLVTLCKTGVRGRIAAEELVKEGYKAAYVTRGLLEWNAPAATKAGLVVTMSGMEKEKISVALSACANSQKTTQTVLVVMASAVQLFRKTDDVLMDGKWKEGVNPEEYLEGCWAGEPFQQSIALWNAFSKSGGVTLLCTTCVKNKGCEGNTRDGTTLMNLPDLLRMIHESKCLSIA
mmetsp:Transcript_53244/g.116893  ORF Transcript_53244/g.116893 Transcript_53244/m.116893 type:complete len:262 (-) Transcript_53244:103-888(-)|eukprot:CAMPEP_0204349568 /NCGR_PEP_ID=MMETSP0469-20131031/29627_1 /ASSEMBLY_ACC=CAM_ASM_000384 /TAXON_ID=2969 /ORGANISM="Oxyrrhis marina" /LENGTH=261 /DNA_ID=CAMNT_0051335781 /DNA_START=51 /DNA_END=836 /DNA_ORIENTATION=+